MLYTKPEVIVLGNAVKAIQGNDKPASPRVLDNLIFFWNATLLAYEADE